MKYIVVLPDGMSDHPDERLGGKTPMECAEKPLMDYFAQNGELLLVNTIGEGLKPGSDVANLSVLGYDPHVYYTGRSPLEAVSMGVLLDAERDTAFRCNLVTLTDEHEYSNKTMLDHCAGEITTAEAHELIQAVSRELARHYLHFHAGVSYRHLLVWRDAPGDFSLAPPHDILDQPVKNHLPNQPLLLELMSKSHDILKAHPINLARIKQQKRPANSIWVWGEGKKPTLTSFAEKYGVTGSVISAVDLIKGLGLCAGLRSIDVEGATGNIHTNYEGKAQAAVDALMSGDDFVFVHVEAPDECGHQNQPENKVHAIELIDRRVIAYIKQRLDAAGEDYAIMVLPDHATPLKLRTHTADPVPCVIYRKGDSADRNVRMTERDAAADGRKIAVGHTLMDFFLKRTDGCCS